MNELYHEGLGDISFDEWNCAKRLQNVDKDGVLLCELPNPANVA
jgi:hypothetical protein